ncbi:unnamed protein product [Didymodactylos carnosus]|uniref:Uncharacterized protein n=1 Tax=Didymodactylos carnosus TaxID=1234261 RepID=A0A815YNI4_9BILA|nr:unnamed protein product [Didymodactylos carnosus]CAF4438456.1 unnamed protein product [Didymodactylos carnosus]
MCSLCTQEHSNVYNNRRVLTSKHYESSIDVEAYKNTLADWDRMVQQLEESINELTIRLRNPITITSPSTNSTDEINN